MPQYLLNHLLWERDILLIKFLGLLIIDKDKDTHVKVSPTHVKSFFSSSNVGNANRKSDIASRWLPTTAT